MSDRDQELDQLLSPLSQLNPDEMKIRRWQAALLQEFPSQQGKSRRRMYEIAKIAVAASIGFAIGAGVFSTRERREDVFLADAGPDDANASATIMHLYAKAD